jgi:hypothetical protein
VSFWLVALLIWIAPALLLGCALLWVRFNTRPATDALSVNAESLSVASGAEEAPLRVAVLVAAE